MLVIYGLCRVSPGSAATSVTDSLTVYAGFMLTTDVTGNRFSDFHGHTDAPTNTTPVAGLALAGSPVTGECSGYLSYTGRWTRLELHQHLPVFSRALFC